ncbi:IS3 family transposase [Clostridium gasigenes]|uniref:IS3 family transposase n=1 Tax=Clostridium gasigenes TaxID=94869 RepID=UPI001C0AE5F6|nr:IS3 family transposase [Clostridium gasigenes]
MLRNAGFDVKALGKQRVDNYIGYYNNDRYQWNLAKLSPNKYYKYLETGECQIKI